MNVIEFTGVAKTYPGPPPVNALRPTDLVVRQNDFITVIGPSGSGKSTFLNVIGLLDRPTEGTYRLDGLDTGDLTEGSRTALRGRRIGFVFQSFHLIGHRTAAENVMLAQLYTGGARRQRLPTALDVLDRVGLAGRAHTATGRLSGGERQRVAVARALVNQPALLLCDEPTGNLDSANTENVLGLIHQLHTEGLTVMVVTHDPSVAQAGERTVLIRDGVLGETGATR